MAVPSGQGSLWDQVFARSDSTPPLVVPVVKEVERELIRRRFYVELSLGSGFARRLADFISRDSREQLNQRVLRNEPRERLFSERIDLMLTGLAAK